MPFCPKCGSEIFEDEAFCNGCGAKYVPRKRKIIHPTAMKEGSATTKLKAETEKETLEERHDMAMLLGEEVAADVVGKEAKYGKATHFDESARVAVFTGDRGVVSRFCPVCKKELDKENRSEICEHCSKNFCESCASKAKKWAGRIGMKEIPVQLLDEYDEPMCKACWKELRFALGKLEKNKRFREEQERKERERKEGERKRLEEERKREDVARGLQEITNSIGMKFVKIPKRNYYMGKHQVTQKEWKAVMGTDPSIFKGDELPVEQVSWDDCQEYVERLNYKEGTYKYRLPTEGEWEHACRAGSTTKYCFGDDVRHLGNYAWYKDNSGRKTHIVGTKRPNKWGLHDMHGNVCEWCQDWYDDKHKYRVYRGGFWGNYPDDCESAYRTWYPPAFSRNYRGSPGGRDHGLGVRLVRSSD